ncbi:hypothetical protein CGCSCA1_v006784 [Colletotrichum siamense]|nr:hypothetical protein CGCSCA1_v006784 [Colletotrichum siamense]
MQPDFNNPDHEWWPRPSDGRLVPLMLQSGTDPYLLPDTSRWTRLGKPISQVAPLVRLSNWIGSSVFIAGTRNFRLDARSLLLAALKLVVAWPLLCLLVCFPDNLGVAGRMIKQHQLNPFAPNVDDQQQSRSSATEEANHRQSAEHSNAAENDQRYVDNIRLDEGFASQRTSETESPEDDRTRARRDNAVATLRPRYLCFVQDFERGTYKTVNVSQHVEANGDDVDLEFVFVSYTRMHFRVSTDEEISKYDYPDEVTREANRVIAARDRATLVKWGMDAAKRVGKRAFWLDFECVRNDDGVARSTSSSEDVYRICDIVRAAHSMIIAIGPKVSDKVTALLNGQQPPPYNREMVTPWLQQWGSRLWTLPELLLCPGEYRIRLYVIGDPLEPKALAKRNFAERAWDDAQEVKELLDHFEGSAILAPSALIEAALTCFSRRQTDQFSQGDIAYATMGLFPRRQRPKVNKTDSGFQAFARLAIANDSR